MGRVGYFGKKLEYNCKGVEGGGWKSIIVGKCAWKVEIFFKINKRDSTFISEMRVNHKYHLCLVRY